MVAITSFFAVLAAILLSVSATLPNDDDHKESTPKNGYKSQGGERNGEYDDEDYKHQYDHANTPDYGDYQRKVAYPTRKPSYTSSSTPIVKSGEYSSIFVAKTSHYTPASLVKSAIIAKASTASFEPHYSPVPAWPASSKLVYVASYATLSIVSKRSGTSSSKFVGPFASPSKAGGAFVAPVAVDESSTYAAAVTPAISAGFSTLQVPRNSTAYSAPTAPTNAAVTQTTSGARALGAAPIAAIVAIAFALFTL